MNDDNSQTNPVVEINVCFRMVIWWGPTHEGMEQHSKCPVAMRCVFWVAINMLTDRTEATSNNVTNDFFCIVLEETAMHRHMSSQLLDVL